MYDAAGDQLHVAFRRSEANERAAVDERGAGNADMHFFRSVIVEHFHVVAQLGAAHDGVVAKQQSFAFEHGAIGNQFHFCHQRAHRLVARHEASGPCWRVFANGAMVGHAFSFGIAQGHADAGVGDAAGAIHFGIVCFPHFRSASEAHHLHVAIFIA